MDDIRGSKYRLAGIYGGGGAWCKQLFRDNKNETRI
jgi:hypothetical protein